MSLFDKVTGQGNQLQQIQKDPLGAARQAGYQIPENLAGNPQAMVMHLIQSGQVGGPKLQQILPMIRNLTGK